MNDIDECSYSISYSQNFLTQCDKIVAEILNIKRNKRICCFSNENQSPELFKENLMWSHYANGCLGAKVIFEVPSKYSAHKVKYFDIESEKLPIVHYENNLLKLIDNGNEKISLNVLNDNGKLSIDTNNSQKNIGEFITTIMSYKKECWQYEQEYRTIIDEERLPIIIKEIILGRKFCKTNDRYEENKKHIDIIVQKIERVLSNSFEKNKREKNSRKELSNNIKIKIYKTKYDKTLHTIKTLKF